MGYAPYPVAEKRRHRRQWRYYETPAGNKPVKKFIDRLSDPDALRRDSSVSRRGT